MTEFLRALGFDPLFYWLPAGTCFGLWMLACVLPHDPQGPLVRRFGSMANFALLLLLAMLAFRWPAIWCYLPVNPDEPQFLASALTMVARHEFWWSDTMSSGPLVAAPLTLPALVGLPLDYAAGRVIGLLLSWGVVLFTALSLRHVHGERLGRLLSLPLACFMIFLHFWDFTAYASEWTPLFLCALAAWLALTAFQADGAVARRWRLAAAGGVLGLLPFSKLQALPLGAAIGIVTAVLVWRQPEADRPHRRRDLAHLLLAFAFTFGGLLLWAWSSGNGAAIYESYLRHNLYYAQDRAVPWAESVGEFRYLCDYSWGYAAFHHGLLLLLGLGLFALRRWPRPAWKPVVFGWCVLAAAYYAVLAPGRAYPHYLLLVTMPLALVVGLQFGYFLRSEGFSPALRNRLLVLFLLAGAGAQLADLALSPHSRLKLVPDPRPRAALVRLVEQLRQPGDSLAVWGWRPELYVETRLPQAVREAHTERQQRENPQRDYFRARFLADVEASRPTFFVDAVGRGGFLYQDRATLGLETFAALHAYVAEHYRLVGEVDSFRLYLRRDRLPPAAP